MTTTTRSYEETVDAVEEALGALEATLAVLPEEDWARPTLLKPATPDAPPWTVLQLAAHMDIFMAITLGLMAEPQQAPPAIDGASFCIACSDGSQGSMLYQYMADHAKGQTPGTIVAAVHGTFKSALEGARNNPPDTIGPAFYGLMRLDDFMATRTVEAVVHGPDLTHALGRPPLSLPKAAPLAAALLHDVLARTQGAGRPAHP